MSEGELEQRLRETKKRTWTDRIGIALSGITAGILIYAISMSVKPVEVKQENGRVQTESWVTNYFGRRVPRQAERYKNAVKQYLNNDYIGLK